MCVPIKKKVFTGAGPGHFRSDGTSRGQHPPWPWDEGTDTPTIIPRTCIPSPPLLRVYPPPRLAPGARPAAQDPRGLPSPKTSLHLSKFCVNTHKFFRLVAIFQRQGGRGMHKHAPDEHTAEGTICFRLRTENISVNANDHQESVIMMEPMT